MKNEINKLIGFLFALIVLVSSCKKKDDTTTATPPAAACTAINNLNVVNIAGFDRPVAIAFSPSGKIVVTENNSYDVNLIAITSAAAHVYVFSNITDFAALLPEATISGIVGPEAAIFDANNNLFITETEVQAGVSIYKPPYSTKLKTIQPGWNNPRGIAIDGSGNLYVADDDDGIIKKVSNPLGTETISDFISSLNHPKSLAISGNFLFVAEYDGNRVLKYNLLNAQLIQSFSVNQPIDIGIKDCMLYVTTHNGNANGNSKVIALKIDDLNNGIQKEYTGFSGAAFGVNADANGNLFVVDFKQGKIRKYIK